jgi:PAS domain S-box-containing protein
MKSADKLPAEIVELRKQAEDIFRKVESPLPADVEGLSPDEIRTMFHELTVHQIELELQNEELRRTQAELDVARTQYFELYDLAPVGYCVLNEQGYVLEANLAFATMLGYARSRLHMQSIFRFFPHYDLMIFQSKMNRLFQMLERQTCDLRMKKKDGTELWVRMEATAAHHEGMPAARVVISDITDSKLAELALKVSEERYRAITEHTHNAICIVDEAGKIVWGNEKMVAISGFPLEQIYNAGSFVDLIAPESQGFVVENFQKFLTGLDYEHHYVFSFMTASGEKRLAEKYMSDFTEQSGQRKLIISIMDITDRRKAEEDKQLLTDQLQQAMKMEAVGRLAGGVAHDFNNLLTGIIGNISLILMHMNPDDPLVGTLTEVNRAAESAAALTRQLLAFSRKQIIEPRVINLNDTLSVMRKMLVRLIGEDIEFITIPGEGLGAVKIDPGQFEQILVNLTLNARDALPGGGKVVIETANVELDKDYCDLHGCSNPGPYVMLSVCDNGHGMSAEVKEHLFEPFFTTKEIGRGTGLGLATIYGIVKQADGIIEIDSDEGRGTTFRIYLPRVTEQVAKREIKNSAAAVEGGDETVLLVEDEDIVRELAAIILKRLGYRVLVTRNGADACELAKSHKEGIDLLFTDIVMPGIDGRELAERLAVTCPEMKVLYTSGYTEDTIVHRGILEEGLNFISKPYHPQELASKLREVLDGKR